MEPVLCNGRRGPHNSFLGFLNLKVGLETDWTGFQPDIRFMIPEWSLQCSMIISMHWQAQSSRNSGPARFGDLAGQM